MVKRRLRPVADYQEYNRQYSRGETDLDFDAWRVQRNADKPAESKPVTEPKPVAETPVEAPTSAPTEVPTTSSPKPMEGADGGNGASGGVIDAAANAFLMGKFRGKGVPAIEEKFFKSFIARQLAGAAKTAGAMGASAGAQDALAQLAENGGFDIERTGNAVLDAAIGGAMFHVMNTALHAPVSWSAAKAAKAEERRRLEAEINEIARREAEAKSESERAELARQREEAERLAEEERQRLREIDAARGVFNDPQGLAKFVQQNQDIAMDMILARQRGEDVDMESLLADSVTGIPASLRPAFQVQADANAVGDRLLQFHNESIARDRQREAEAEGERIQSNTTLDDYQRRWDKEAQAQHEEQLRAAETSREFLTAEEARAQQKALNDRAERNRINALRIPVIEVGRTEDPPKTLESVPDPVEQEASIAADKSVDVRAERENAERKARIGEKVQKEVDNFFKAVKNYENVIADDGFNAKNADLLAAAEDGIRRNNPQMVKENLARLAKKAKAFATPVAEEQKPVDANNNNSYTTTQESNDGIRNTASKPVQPVDDFQQLQSKSRGMSNEERENYRNGSAQLGEQELGVPDGGRAANRRGTVVGALRRRVQSAGGGRGLDGAVELSIPAKMGHPSESFKIGRVDGQTFRDVFEVVRSYLKNGELVDLHDSYGDDVKCYLSEDGLSGFAVEADGNLVSVFSMRPGSLKAMASEMLKAGANHLDVYNSNARQPLAHIYEKVLGFKPASEMSYSMKYDHDNIAANHNKPNVVFMVRPKDGQTVEKKSFGETDYDDAVNHQKLQMAWTPPPPKSNRLRRADGTDPLAEAKPEPKPVEAKPESKPIAETPVEAPASAPTKAPTTSSPKPTEVADGENGASGGTVDNPPAPAVAPKLKAGTKTINYFAKKLPPLLAAARQEDGSFNPDAIRRNRGNGGLALKQLKQLKEHPEIIDALNLSRQEADNIRTAVDAAFEKQRLVSPNSRTGKLTDKGQDNYAVSAERKLAKLKAKPDSLKLLGEAHQQVLSAWEAAQRKVEELQRRAKDEVSSPEIEEQIKSGKSAVDFWQKKLVDLQDQIANLPADKQKEVMEHIREFAAKNEKQSDTNSLETREGKTLDVAVEADAPEPTNEESDTARLNRIAQNDDDATGGSSLRRGAVRDANRRGSRNYGIETDENGKKEIVWRNDMGEVYRRVPLSMEKLG